MSFADPDAPAADRPLHRQWRLLLLVGAGGMAGTALRYWISHVWPVTPSTFPNSTLVINLVGAFALGLLLEVLGRRGSDTGARRTARLVVGTGLLGGFTTYSTLATEATLLVRAGDGGLAASYGLLTLFVGLVATGAGIALGAQLSPGSGVIPFWIAVAGGVGAMTRFATDGAIGAALVARRDPSHRPLGATPVPIMLINIAGSFLLGLFTGLAAYHGLNSSPRLILGTGFCGGFTTFSTASFETFRLLQQRRWWPAALSGAGTLGLTMLAAEVGLLVAQQ